LVVAVMMIAFDRRLLDGPVHPLDLAVGRQVLHLSQAVVDAVFAADSVENVVKGILRWA
jgi:hypothetical protein